MSNDNTENEISTNYGIQVLKEENREDEEAYEEFLDPSEIKNDNDDDVRDDEKDGSGSESGEALDDGSNYKTEATDFDAFYDGVNIQRKYQLRRSAKAVYKVRSNKAQITYLCQYMAKNPKFAAGEFPKNAMGLAKNHRQWQQLKMTLDKLGSTRTVAQWKIAWRDQKRKARAGGSTPAISGGLTPAISGTRTLPESEPLRPAKSVTRILVPVPYVNDASALVVGGIQQGPVCLGPEVSIGNNQHSDNDPLASTSREAVQSAQRQTEQFARRRVRPTLPQNQFLRAQLELNSLIKELVGEVRRSNSLREEHLKLFVKNTEETESPPSKKRKLKTDNFLFSCTKCPKAFDSKTGLLNHVRRHQTVRQYVCALCQASFTTNEQLIQHKVEHADEDRIFLCKTCKMAFTNHCDFLTHEISHSKRSSFKCAECDSWQSRKYIKIHIQKHFDLKVECQECNKTYRNDQALKQHILQAHTEKDKVECVECGKFFKSQYYEVHLSTHTGVKKFQCLYCGQGFANRNGRRVHTRQHTNEKPFTCDICDKSFHQNTTLKRHRERHGERTKFKCQQCDKVFKMLEGLRQHERFHKRENIYFCPLCEKPCQTKQCLRSHMAHKHTTTKSFKCGLCDMDFKTSSCLKKHNRSKGHQRASYGAKYKNES